MPTRTYVPAVTKLLTRVAERLDGAGIDPYDVHITDTATSAPVIKIVFRTSRDLHTFAESDGVAKLIEVDHQTHYTAERVVYTRPGRVMRLAHYRGFSGGD